MTRRTFYALIFFSAAVAGCRTCDNPYDHCGPVIDSEFHPAGLRSGGAMAGPRVGPEEIPAPRITPPAPPAMPGDKPPDDAPPALEETGTTSVMSSRFDYAH